MTVELLMEHHLEFLSLKEAAQTCLILIMSNATLLEITCHGSNVYNSMQWCTGFSFTKYINLEKILNLIFEAN